MVPALSVAVELRAEGIEVHFAGGDRAEAELVPAEGYAFHAIRARGLSRTSRLDALKAAALVPGAILAAARLIRSLRPDAVMGGGGYIAGVVGIAAVLTRTPLVLTEADSHLGLSNRVLAPFARRVCLAFPIAGREGERWLVTGRPVPAPFGDREAARERFGIPQDATCILVTGGSLGARSINTAAVEAFSGSPFHVLHLAGERDLPTLQSPRPEYLLEGYVDDFGQAVLASDLAVARAGGSVFELAAHGCPAVLVPYPHAAADHQRGNAEWMARAGAAVIVDDGDLTPGLLGRVVGGLLADRARLERMSAASRSLARPDSAATVAREMIAAGGGAASV